jgi:hypothetical protein
MEPKEGNTVLMAAAYGPFLAIRLGVQYLRLKRRANQARGRFYRELVRGGLPKEHAAGLADQNAEAISIKSLVKTAGPVPAVFRQGWGR